MEITVGEVNIAQVGGLSMFLRTKGLPYFGPIGVIALLFINSALAQAATPFKVLTFNVGTAHEEGFQPDCNKYKLCHKDAIERIQKLVSQAQPDIILFQETQGIEQLFGTFANGPVLDSTVYDGQCAEGVAKIQEVCVAWKRTRFAMIGDASIACPSMSMLVQVDPEEGPKGGGAQGCSLRAVDGSIARLEVVSIHGNTAGDSSRLELLDAIWKRLVDQGAPSVVGGDLNTPSCTSGEPDCAHPAPSSFGTIYGRQMRGYGLWNPDDNFYGEYILKPGDSAPSSEGSHSTHYLRRLDHLFANFGARPVRTVDEEHSITQPCNAQTGPWGTRVPFDGGLTVIRGGMGWKTDHYPILSCLLL